MTRLRNLTPRNALIAAHDALATAAALLASFYLHFEGDLLTDRLPLLLQILPWFIAFSVVVCYVFNLTTTKWRFISLPDALNILRAATVLAVAITAVRWRGSGRPGRGRAHPGSVPAGQPPAREPGGSRTGRSRRMP